MTFANCPKCGSSNVTTAGVCANCGWTRFPQVMGAGESEEAVYELVGEIEIKVTGKALLDDYKRLLFENNSLTVRIAELEAERRWRIIADGEMPEDRATVLVAFKNREILTATYYKHYEGFGGVDNWWDIEGWHSGNVTHWMTLPSAPESEDE